MREDSTQAVAVVPSWVPRDGQGTDEGQPPEGQDGREVRVRVQCLRHGGGGRPVRGKETGGRTQLCGGVICEGCPTDGEGVVGIVSNLRHTASTKCIWGKKI